MKRDTFGIWNEGLIKMTAAIFLIKERSFKFQQPWCPARLTCCKNVQECDVITEKCSNLLRWTGESVQPEDVIGCWEKNRDTPYDVDVGFDALSSSSLFRYCCCFAALNQFAAADQSSDDDGKTSAKVTVKAPTDQSV